MIHERREINEISATTSLAKCIGTVFELWVQGRANKQGLVILLNGGDRDQNLRRQRHLEVHVELWKESNVEKLKSRNLHKYALELLLSNKQPLYRVKLQG